MTPPKKPTTKRSPRAAKPPAADDEAAPGGIRPVVISGEVDTAPVDMVTLVEIDDVAYQMPRNPPASMVLSWMLDAQEHGSNAANNRLARRVLGGGLNVLAADPRLQPEQLIAVYENIGAVFFASDNFAKIAGAPDPS